MVNPVGTPFIPGDDLNGNQARSVPVVWISFVDASGNAVPAFSMVGESGVPTSLTDRILSFDYEDCESKTDLVKFTLSNFDLELIDHPIIEKGTEIQVSWGYAGNMCPARKAIVKSGKGDVVISIEAEDKGSVLHKIDKVRTFENQKRSDVVRTLAVEHGYTEPDRQFIDDTEETLAVITQSAETDGQFLRKMAELEGFEFYIDFDGFHWHAKRTDQKPARTYAYFVPPNVGDILKWSFESSAAGAKGSNTAKGTDPIEKKPVSQTADASNTPRTTVAANQDLKTTAAPGQASAPAAGGTAPPAGTNAAAAATNQVPQSSTVIDPRSGIATTVFPPAGSATKPTSATSSSAAKREATGDFVKGQMAAYTLNLTLIGDPTFVAKSIIEVEGLKTRLSGKWYVSDVKHGIKPGNYDMNLKCKRDGTDGKGAGQGKGNPNTKEGDKGSKDGSGPLQSSTVIDPRSGIATTVFKDSSRDNASQKSTGTANTGTPAATPPPATGAKLVRQVECVHV